AVSHESTATTSVLPHIAEFDARRLYLPAGYPSMAAYCVHHLHLSEDSAYKRIHAARAAREFPAIFDAVADGRLHLTGVGLLAPHRTVANAKELLAAAARRTKSEILLLLAERFPRTEPLAFVQPLSDEVHAPAHVEPATLRHPEHAPAHVAASSAVRAGGQVAPLAAGRFVLQFAIGQETWELLQYAQALLGHVVPSGDVAEVF